MGSIAQECVGHLQLHTGPSGGGQSERAREGEMEAWSW